MSETLTGPNICHYEHERAAASALLLREALSVGNIEHSQALAEQARLNEATLFSEMLEGRVVTDIAFETRADQLYVPQRHGGSEWRLIHENGLNRAEAIVANRPDLVPYLRWAQAEQTEAEIQSAMVAGGRSMALVKLSLCGDDLMPATSLREVGRRPEIKRAFLRVSVISDGQLVLYNRSIDGVNVADGRLGLVSGWGETGWPGAEINDEANSADLVEAAVILDENQMSRESMHGLADRLVANFDRLQFQRTGRVYHGGLCPDNIDTFRFVLNDHNEILDNHMRQLTKIAHANYSLEDLAFWSDRLRYNTNSAYKQLREGTFVWLGGEQTGSVDVIGSVDRAGGIERDKGTEYYGCETTLGVTGRTSSGLAGISNTAALEFSWISCKICGAKQYSNPCSIYFACGKCDSRLAGGKVIVGKNFKNPGKS